MSQKMLSNAAAFHVKMSVDWVRRFLPCEYVEGINGRRVRIYDKATIEQFMRDREAQKEEKAA